MKSLLKNLYVAMLVALTALVVIWTASFVLPDIAKSRLQQSWMQTQFQAQAAWTIILANRWSFTHPQIVELRVGNTPAYGLCWYLTDREGGGVRCDHYRLLESDVSRISL